MEWQTPVWQRTAAMVAARHPDCYMSPQLLNRIEGNTDWLAAQLGVTGLPTRRWSEEEFLTPAQMQRQLQNLAALHRAWYGAQSAPPLPPGPATDYETINQMEALQAKLYAVWQRHEHRMKCYAGEAYAGTTGGLV